MRPSRGETMLKIASIIAERGTCDRKQVGAVIAREGRIISVGYNGAPPGLPHCDENNHGWGPNPHNRSSVYWGAIEEGMAEGLAMEGCQNATHAEANALAFAAKYGVPTDKADLFVTVSPCEVCARLLIAAGIQSVSYLEEYRDESGINLLLAAGIVPVYWK